MKGVLEFKGLTNWLEELNAAGKNVDDAVTDLLIETKPFVEQELKENLLKTRQPGEEWSGETEATLDVSDVRKDGNYIFIETSIGGTTREEAVVAKEYGNTRQAAEPFFRPTFRGHRLKNKLKEAMKALLQRYGLQS